MDKAVVVFVFFLLLCACKKEEKCIQKPPTPISPSFVDWSKPYLTKPISYVRFKSNKGLEESLEITSSIDPSKWYLKDNDNCLLNKGEWREYNFKSTIFKKRFDMVLFQYSTNQTALGIINRSGPMEESSIIFNNDGSNYVQYTPCDTCTQYFKNYSINNVDFNEVVRVICFKSLNALHSEVVEEIYFAKGFGLVRFIASDDTVWDIVN